LPLSDKLVIIASLSHCTHKEGTHKEEAGVVSSVTCRRYISLIEWLTEPNGFFHAIWEQVQQFALHKEM
jgi:hypothetical protein